MGTPTTSTALVRLGAREVEKITLRRPNGSFERFLALRKGIWAVAIDPVLQDGHQVKQQRPDGTEGPMRQLGFAKFVVGGTLEPQAEGPDHLMGATIRNATQVEIDAFAPAELADADLEDQLTTKNILEFSKTTNGRLLRAVLALLREELNLHTVRFNAVLDAINTATDLPSLKAAIGGIPVLPIRERTQILTAIKTKVEGNE